MDAFAETALLEARCVLAALCSLAVPDALVVLVALGDSLPLSLAGLWPRPVPRFVVLALDVFDVLVLLDVRCR
ncbi:MAG: hypothetical protein LBC63_03310 [Holophagales bacterium]|nr:hypothetical protein [Holophagales bacterium]